MSDVVRISVGLGVLGGIGLWILTMPEAVAHLPPLARFWIWIGQLLTFALALSAKWT